MDRVTAYEIKDDAMNTGELDYINGGMYETLRKNSLITIFQFFIYKIITF